MISSLLSFFSSTAQSCGFDSSFFFGFPHWYDFLSGIRDDNNICVPQISSLSDIWLIVAAVIEILLRVAGLVAVGIVIYGGITYITSQGEPEKTAEAKSTIVNALVGLAISIMSAFIVTFIAGSVHN